MARIPYPRTEDLDAEARHILQDAPPINVLRMLSVMNLRASDETLAGVARHLPPRQIVELIMATGCYRMLCMMLKTCGVELEQSGDVPLLTQAEWQARMRVRGPE